MASEPSAVERSEAVNRRRARIVLVLLAAIVVPVGATLLYLFPPTQYTFLPPCFFYQFTGLHCPGCGGTRCVSALMHGEWAQALAWNPLAIVALPFLCFVAFNTFYMSWTGKKGFGFRTPGWAIVLLAVVIVAFWILRNIDAYPWTLLAPHEI